MRNRNELFTPITDQLVGTLNNLVKEKEGVHPLVREINNRTRASAKVTPRTVYSIVHRERKAISESLLDKILTGTGASTSTLDFPWYTWGELTKMRLWAGDSLSAKQRAKRNVNPIKTKSRIRCVLCQSALTKSEVSGYLNYVDSTNRLRMAVCTLCSPIIKAMAIREGKYSAHKGVSWSNQNKRWTANKATHGHKLYLGSYKTEQEAARVVEIFEIILAEFDADIEIKWKEISENFRLIIKLEGIDSVIGRGRYLCGCKIEDSELEFCPLHGLKQYGWRTPMVQGIQGNMVVDYSKFATHKSEVDYSKFIGVDKRDNRDPQEVGLQVQAERMLRLANLEEE